MKLVLCTAALLAQLPMFRAEARLVVVDVVVDDDRGRPAAGLTRDDFTLVDNGKPQAIELFVAQSDADRGAPRPLEAGEFSNRANGRAGGAATVILFDRLNTPADDQRRARDQIVRALRQIKPRDRIALYVLDSTRVSVLHDFTSDADALVRALASQPMRPPQELDATVADAVAPLRQFLSNSVDTIRDTVASDRIGMTIAGVSAIVHHLNGVSGRKNLVWVASEFPSASPTDNEAPTIHRLVRLIDEAAVAVYPVSARGLNANTASPVTMNGNGNGFQVAAGGRAPGAPVDTPPPAIAPRAIDFDGLKALAADTGGRAFFNTNDIADAVTGALADQRLTYVLGFYPSPAGSEGEFREISVKVNRPGLRVRHRRGYRVWPTFAVDLDPPTRRTNDLASALRSGLDAADVGVAVRVGDFVAGDGGARAVSVTIALDPGAIVFRPHGETFEGLVDFVIAQHTADDRWFETEGATVDLDVTAVRRDQLARSGIAFTRKIVLRNDAESMHVGVRDPVTGATGSVVVRPVPRP